jgi:anthranilate phosphoribosyltransferase
MTMKDYIQKCLAGEHLSVAEASAALELIMSGQATEVQIAGLLIALRAKGETVDEVVGFAQTMREKSLRVVVDDPDAIDMCGTGGDGLGTFNISTVATFVAAGAGVTVAKHGNRSVSSRSGSADLLVALGVNIQLPPEQVGECVNAQGVGFLFAPMFHPAMKYAAKPRTELGVRTIFNMLGPITNPAGVRKQLVGAYRPEVAKLLAGALKLLATTKACVVHSDDGMDEIAVSGNTTVHEVGSETESRTYEVSPEMFGLTLQDAASSLGGNAEENAAIALRVLSGEKGPQRDVVVANAAMGIYVAGKAANPDEGSHRAAEAIDSGRAMKSLKGLVEFSRRA